MKRIKEGEVSPMGWSFMLSRRVARVMKRSALDLERDRVTVLQLWRPAFFKRVIIPCFSEAKSNSDSIMSGFR